jgi:hypothetical protein
MEKSRAVPKTTYEPSREELELERIREENHQISLQKLDQTRALSGNFMRTEKTAKTQSKLTKILEERDNDLQFEQFRANPPPKSQVKSFLFNVVQTFTSA